MIDISREELKKLMFDKTNKEAAKYLGICTRTLVRILGDFDLRYEEMKYPDLPEKLSKLQNDILDACMLGDGGINKYGRFKLKMKLTSKEYVEYVKNIFDFVKNELYEEITKKPIKIKKQVIHNHSKNTGLSHAISFYTPFLSFFKEARKIWYPEGKKIVNRNLVLNEVILSNWFVQDGCNMFQKRSACFCTCSFSIDDVEFLMNEIFEKFNIKTTMQYNNTHPIIVVGAYEYLNFMEIIKPHIVWDCFQYKCDTSKFIPPKPNYCPGKLTWEKAEEIRGIYKEGNLTQKQIAKVYGVTQSAVGHIVNYVNWSKP